MTATLSSRAQDVLRQVDLPRLLADHRVPVVMKGARPWATCWVHQDTNPSVQLNDPQHSTKGRWTYYCHVCRDCRGDALNVVKELRGLETADAMAFLEKYIGQQGSQPSPIVLPPTSTSQGQVVSRAEQHQAAKVFLGLLDRTVPSAQRDAETYLRSRGASATSIAATGGGRFIRKLDWFRLVGELRNSPHIDLLLHANLVVQGKKGLRFAWFDDVVLSASRARSGEDLYFWGRRIEPTFAPDMKYQNQRIDHGIRHTPFGLDAVVEAARTGGVLRVVEGPITALGSRSLTDGQAAPTFAVLHRLGWSREDPRQVQEWSVLLDDLRKCERVEVCPDNDSKPATLAQSVDLAGRAVQWMRKEGVRAEIRLFQDFRGSADRSLFGKPFGYHQKDFADVARAQAGEIRPSAA